MHADLFYFSLAAKKKHHSPSPDYSVESDYSEDQEDAEDYRHGKSCNHRSGGHTAAPLQFLLSSRTK
jgi:hypothetical protein